MKVFVDGLLSDSSQNVIGVVLDDAARENIANMAPGATVYSEFVRVGEATKAGVREFAAGDVAMLLDMVKAEEREGAVQLDWWPPVSAASEVDRLQLEVAALRDVLEKFRWAAAPERHQGVSAYPYEEIGEVLERTTVTAVRYSTRIRIEAVRKFVDEFNGAYLKRIDDRILFESRVGDAPREATS